MHRDILVHIKINIMLGKPVNVDHAKMLMDLNPKFRFICYVLYLQLEPIVQTYLNMVFDENYDHNKKHNENIKKTKIEHI